MGKTVLTFITDTHHYSKTLGTKGEAYMLRSDSDQKCLGETGDIIDSAFEKIGNSDCDALMIIGDLTNDGERVSHEEMREKLYKLREKKKVYIVTATHDWCCDRNPRRFDGDKVYNDVPTLHHNEIYDFYYDFGPADAVSEYRTTLGPASYAVDIGENVTLLGLIDDKNGRGGAGFKREHLNWITEQIKSAKERGRMPVAMEHHLLYPHISPLFTNGARCKDGENYLNTFADAGLQFVFVGHSHMQRIDCHTSPKGNRIYEVNVASLVGYPGAIVTLTVDDLNAEVTAEHLKEAVIDGKKVDLTSFLRDHAVRMISVVFEAARNRDSEMLSKRLSALGLKKETFEKYEIIIGPVLEKIAKMTVNDAGKVLNIITFGKAIDKTAVKEIGETKITDIVSDMFLKILDGANEPYSPETAVYKAVRGAMSLPLRVCRTFHLNGSASRKFAQLDRAAEEMLTGGKISNNHLIIRK